MKLTRVKSGRCPRLLLAAWFVVSTSACYAAAALPSKAAVAATVKRESARCRARSDLDACYDAVRRNPGDAALSMALGDALMHVRRADDAARSYRRAAALAPRIPGLAAKLKAADANSAGKRFAASSPEEPSPADRTAPKRFSNAAVYGQSH